MSSSSAPAGASARLVLSAIGLGAFAIGVTEFMPMGLLPAIAEGLQVGIPAAGQLVTAYAAGVMIAAPIMTLGLARFGGRRALLAAMAIYVLGSILSTLAPEYWSLMAGRIVTSACQGAFFGFAAVVAISVVPPERHASAVATMFMGISIANIGGVPAAAWMGETLGWRAAFAATVALGLAALAALAATLPEGERGRRPDAKRELATLLRPRMLATLAGTVLFAGGFFAVYTYVAPILRLPAGADPVFVTLTLSLIGLGLTLGNWLGGKLADRSVERGAVIALGALALSSFLLPFATHSRLICAAALGVWAITAFLCVPALQMRAMRAAADAPSLAAAMNIAAFNLGNALGAALGGAAIGAGLGLGWIPVLGGLLALAGLASLRLRRA